MIKGVFLCLSSTQNDRAFLACHSMPSTIHLLPITLHCSRSPRSVKTLSLPLTSITLPIQIMILVLIPVIPLGLQPHARVAQPDRLERRVVTRPAALAIARHVERALQPMVRPHAAPVGVLVVMALPARGDRVAAAAGPILAGADVDAGDGGAFDDGTVVCVIRGKDGAGGGIEDGGVRVAGELGEVVGLDGFEGGCGADSSGGGGEGEDSGDGDHAEFGKHFGW